MTPILQPFQPINFQNRVPRVALIGAHFTTVHTSFEGGNEPCKRSC
ncbi:hypothetical protein SAMN04488030_0686 [Aliiroseovarius halocynthiae]|nr:hypothetical protein SAMN04488030_0686 [Aliiroseovarius halocynthiae]